MEIILTVLMWTSFDTLAGLQFPPLISSYFDGSLRRTKPSNTANGVSANFSGNQTALCPNGWLLATAPGLDFKLDHQQHCLLVSHRKESWSRANNECRLHRGFMVKLDKFLMVDDKSFFDHLRLKGVYNIYIHLLCSHILLHNVYICYKRCLICIYLWLFDTGKYVDGDYVDGEYDYDNKYNIEKEYANSEIYIMLLIFDFISIKI